MLNISTKNKARSVNKTRLGLPTELPTPDEPERAYQTSPNDMSTKEAADWFHEMTKKTAKPDEWDKILQPGTDREQISYYSESEILEEIRAGEPCTPTGQRIAQVIDDAQNCTPIKPVRDPEFDDTFVRISTPSSLTPGEKTTLEGLETRMIEAIRLAKVNNAVDHITDFELPGYRPITMAEIRKEGDTIETLIHGDRNPALVFKGDWGALLVGLPHYEPKFAVVVGDDGAKKNDKKKLEPHLKLLSETFLDIKHIEKNNTLGISLCKHPGTLLRKAMFGTAATLLIHYGQNPQPRPETKPELKATAPAKSITPAYGVRFSGGENPLADQGIIVHDDPVAKPADFKEEPSFVEVRKGEFPGATATEKVITDLMEIVELFEGGDKRYYYDVNYKRQDGKMVFHFSRQEDVGTSTDDEVNYLQIELQGIGNVWMPLYWLTANLGERKMKRKGWSFTPKPVPLNIPGFPEPAQYRKGTVSYSQRFPLETGQPTPSAVGMLRHNMKYRHEAGWFFKELNNFLQYFIKPMYKIKK